MLALAAGFLDWRSVWLGTPPAVFPDSASYRSSGVTSVPLVSLVGHAPRAVLVPAFLSAFPTDSARVDAQWAVSVAAWLVLATVVWTSLHSMPARVTGAAGVLAIGGLPETWSWDFAVLSESLTISVAVLVLAAALRWAVTPSPLSGAALGVAVVLWVAARVDVGPAVLVGSVALLVLAVRRGARSPAAAALVLVAFVSVGWGTWTATRLDPAFQASSSTGLSYSQELFAFELRERLGRDPQALQYLGQHGMPACPGVTATAGPPLRGRAFLSRVRSCPGLRAWATRHGRSTLLSFVASHPATYRRWLARDAERLAGGAVYVRRAASAGPPALRALFYGRPATKPLAALLGLVVTATAAGLTLRADLPGAAVGVVAAVTAVASVAGLLAGQLLSAGEVERSALPEGTLLRLACVLLLAAGVDRLMVRRDRGAAAG